MRREVFQKALFATARVACCATLLAACQKPESKVNDPTGVQSPESQPDGPAAPMSLAECKAHTAAVYTTKTETKSDQTVSCCDQIAHDIDKTGDPMTSTSEWVERGECCDALGWSGSMACTPWGPPCPPAMGA